MKKRKPRRKEPKLPIEVPVRPVDKPIRVSAYLWPEQVAWHRDEASLLERDRKVDGVSTLLSDAVDMLRERTGKVADVDPRERFVPIQARRRRRRASSSVFAVREIRTL